MPIIIFIGILFGIGLKIGSSSLKNDKTDKNGYKKRYKKSLVLSSLELLEFPSSIVLTYPKQINTAGDVVLTTEELVQQDPTSLFVWGDIKATANRTGFYQGLLLDDGGLEKLFIDEWWLLGFSWIEAEEMVGNGLSVGNDIDNLYRMCDKIDVPQSS